MNIHIIYFTREAERVAFELRAALEKTHEVLTIASGGRRTSLPYIPVSLWTLGHFRTGEALVFVGAAGIAVRSIAKHIRDKRTDPAVVVVDEGGRYAIPILSGHIGEANLLARRIGEITGGTAVITTASDVRGMFAADVFAEKNGLQIGDPQAAKRFASAMLDYGSGTLVIPGELYEVVRIQGEIPPELTLEKNLPETGPDAVCMVTPYEREDGPLRLIPRNLILGAGCRRGTPGDALIGFARELLARYHMSERAVSCVCSIDLKEDEAGLRELAGHFSVPFCTFPREVLRIQELEAGGFSSSAFVEETVGIDNVCERAAAAAGAKRIAVRKTAREGMTLAVGLGEIPLRFEMDR